VFKNISPHPPKLKKTLKWNELGPVLAQDFLRFAVTTFSQVWNSPDSQKQQTNWL
jgi:hypothetical protein